LPPAKFANSPTQQKVTSSSAWGQVIAIYKHNQRCAEVSTQILAILAFGGLRIERFRLEGLRIAGSLSQHLAQLSLSLRRLTREGFVPYANKLHVGVLEGELNPRSIRYLSSDGNAVGYRNFFQTLDKPAAAGPGGDFVCQGSCTCS
jgi:hypothetical protein